jgi:hypothetical protein
MGSSGWLQSFHFTLGGAVRKAGSLPSTAHVLILARGILPPPYAAERGGPRGWLALHPAAEPAWYRREGRLNQLAAAEAARFERPATRYAVAWRTP